MGKTFEVNSLDDMCEVMCYNRVPKQKEQNWIFTFCLDSELGGHYVKIYGTFSSARNEMFLRYGDRWAFQYSEEEFDGPETELEVSNE